MGRIIHRVSRLRTMWFMLTSAAIPIHRRRGFLAQPACGATAQLEQQGMAVGTLISTPKAGARRGALEV